MSPTLDSTLADPQQIIVDLQRELAERTAERDEARRRLDERTSERDEALHRETATAEVLGVINSSRGDLAPVFDAILEKATRVCQADSGHFLTLDGEHLRTAAMYQVPPAFADFMTRNPPQPGPHTAVGRILRGERV